MELPCKQNISEDFSGLSHTVHSDFLSWNNLISPVFFLAPERNGDL